MVEKDGIRMMEKNWSLMISHLLLLLSVNFNCRYKIMMLIKFNFGG